MDADMSSRNWTNYSMTRILATLLFTDLGFGGIGKTALAIEAVKNFRSGRVFVLSLMSCPNSSSVISKIAIDVTDLGVPMSYVQTEVLRKLKGKEPILNLSGQCREKEISYN